MAPLALLHPSTEYLTVRFFWLATDYVLADILWNTK